MISFKRYLLLVLLLFGHTSHSRLVELEFEKVAAAVSYQFEFRLEGKLDVLKTLSQDNVFVEIDLPFDHYEYRQRAYDKRNVPGTWSNWEKFVVTIPELKITEPKAGIQIQGGRAEQLVKIAWQGAEGVQKYKIEIVDLLSNKLIEQQNVEANTLDLKLPSGSLYEVRLTTIIANQKWPDLQASAKAQFAIQAPALGTTQVTTEKNKYMRQITWAAEPLAETYEIVLERFSNLTKKWSVIFVSKNFKSTKLEFDPKWRGGNYRLAIVAKAKYRKDSPVCIEKFILASDRSPATEYNELVMRSIDRVDGYFSQISWLMTQMRLNSYSFETATQANTQPLGGTLRAGLGYFKYNSQWGISSYLNTTRMILENRNSDFASFEVNGLYRTKFSYRDELRLSIGLSSLEVPVLIGDNRLNQFSIKNSNVMGPKLALEYWYSLGPKVGLQMNYQQSFYDILGNSAAPNGANLKMPKSYQLGLMASYRISANVTGLLGLIHQEEIYEYEATIRAPQQPIAAGSMNQGALKADYIGLMVEIGL